MKTRFFLASSVLAVAAAFTAFACGSSKPPAFDDGDSGIDPGPGFDPNKEGGPPAGCVGLECSVVACPGGAKTTLSGKTLAPNAVDPLYNVILYVPNATLDPFPAGVTCDKCGAITSGEPIVTALSSSDGTFSVENVPSGDNIPLVLQVGRWRRQVTIPHVDACKDNALGADLTRLPRNQTEGDIPLIALATSPYDPEECILKKIGIDTTEFTSPDGTGRIHVYQGAGATVQGQTLPSSATLWATPENLLRYDITMFPCQTEGKPDAAGNTNIKNYADNGGRVFVTDLSEDVIMSGAAPWPSTAKWGGFGGFTNPASIDTTFPKGAALADWLQSTGATSTKGQLTIEDPYDRFSAVNAPSQRWLYTSTDTVTYSFNTPVEAASPDDQCGRVVYSSFHIATPAEGSFPV